MTWRWPPGRPCRSGHMSSGGPQVATKILFCLVQTQESLFSQLPFGMHSPAYRSGYWPCKRQILRQEKGRLEKHMGKWLSGLRKCYQMPTAFFNWPRFSSTMTAGGSLAEKASGAERWYKWAVPPTPVLLFFPPPPSTSHFPSYLPPFKFVFFFFNTSRVFAKTLILTVIPRLRQCV